MVCNTQHCGFWQIGLAQNRGGRKAALLCFLVHPFPFAPPQCGEETTDVVGVVKTVENHAARGPLVRVWRKRWREPC